VRSGCRVKTKSLNMLRRALLGLLIALALAPPALADGDPASDFLAPNSTRVFMTFAVFGPPTLEQRLTTTTKRVTAAGLPIKVAVLSRKYDLGAVKQLWGKPQTYARFLGSELRLFYHDTLLVVMPQGFGIVGPYPHGKAVAALAGIDTHRDTTPKGLTDSAEAALRALAQADGISVDGRSGSGLPLPLIAAGFMALTGIGGGLLVVRRGSRKR
jgi:hypothetical protein